MSRTVHCGPPQTRPDQNIPVQSYVVQCLTIYLPSRSRDLGHAEVSGTDDIIMTGSVPAERNDNELSEVQRLQLRQQRLTSPRV